jgi:soluble cytochrome b562
MTFTTQELVEAVKDHAEANYEKGWDVIVECWTDADITAKIGKARTPKGAIKKFAGLASIWYDQEQDAINSAF